MKKLLALTSILLLGLHGCSSPVDSTADAGSDDQVAQSSRAESSSRDETPSRSERRTPNRDTAATSRERDERDRDEVARERPNRKKPRSEDRDRGREMDERESRGNEEREDVVRDRRSRDRGERPEVPPLVAAFPETSGTVGLTSGSLIPEITGADLEGTDFKLSDYQGKVIMLDFWGDW